MRGHWEETEKYIADMVRALGAAVAEGPPADAPGAARDAAVADGIAAGVRRTHAPKRRAAVLRSDLVVPSSLLDAINRAAAHHVAAGHGPSSARLDGTALLAAGMLCEEVIAEDIADYLGTIPRAMARTARAAALVARAQRRRRRQPVAGDAQPGPADAPSRSGRLNADSADARREMRRQNVPDAPTLDPFRLDVHSAALTAEDIRLVGEQREVEAKYLLRPPLPDGPLPVRGYVEAQRALAECYPVPQTPGDLGFARPLPSAARPEPERVTVVVSGALLSRDGGSQTHTFAVPASARATPAAALGGTVPQSYVLPAAPAAMSPVHALLARAGIFPGVNAPPLTGALAAAADRTSAVFSASALDPAALPADAAEAAQPAELSGAEEPADALESSAADEDSDGDTGLHVHPAPEVARILAFCRKRGKPIVFGDKAPIGVYPPRTFI